MWSGWESESYTEDSIHFREDLSLELSKTVGTHRSQTIHLIPALFLGTAAEVFLNRVSADFGT